MSLGLQDGEVALETPDSCLVISSAGASGIVNLAPLPRSSLQSVGEAFKPDPNTNLMTTRILLPTIKHSGPSWPKEDVVIITAVFAIHDEKNAMTLQGSADDSAHTPRRKVPFPYIIHIKVTFNL
ncbi:hypothetical protein J3459_016796 [Metarhizium acridum]|nr:hypothetical protein J3459_019428 [Metarhizium acridum]KAG8410974.1 hypothetical protein J3459_016796 [Metarhizium acridum]